MSYMDGDGYMSDQHKEEEREAYISMMAEERMEAELMLEREIKDVLIDFALNKTNLDTAVKRIIHLKTY